MAGTREYRADFFLWRGAFSALVLALSCGGESEEPVRRVEEDPASPSATGAKWYETDPRNLGEEDVAGDAQFGDEACEAPTERVIQNECDPFGPSNACGDGMGCVPFVDYPDSPCDPEVFGARCDWVGSGAQGTPCNVESCSAGFICVATGQGTQCAQLCAPGGANNCPSGLICASIDIEGIGTCF